MEKISALQKARFSYQPKLPEAVKGNVADIVVKLGNPTESVSDQEALKALLKM